MARVNRHRARAAAAAAAVGALVLTGCGIHPGQAAVVGSTDISPEQVDETAAVVCLVDQTVGGVQAVARSKAVEFLVGAELIERFGASEGALPTPGQLSQSPAIEQIQNDARSLPAAVQQDYVDTITSLLASQQTLVNVGEQRVDPAEQANPDAALAAGSAAYSEWLAAESPDVSVDPRYGEWDSGRLVPGDSSLSVAVSDGALAADGGGELPATQVCS
ncbi:hypothetical protein KLP28_11590 [Nocardioidaceae bacterium]|nr:hypothetical protein KLP28_11590 [Nocardioidaceae bacterium]